MLRFVRHAASKSKISRSKSVLRYYSNESITSKSSKVIFGLVVATGTGLGGGVVYAKYYDTEFRKTLKNYLPFINNLFKLLPDIESKSSSKLPTDSKESAATSSSLNEKIDREKATLDSQKLELKSKDVSSDDKFIENNNLSKPITESEKVDKKDAVSIPEKQDLETVFNETELSEMIEKLNSNSQETLTTYKYAEEAVRKHTKSIYEALDLPEGSDNNLIWKEAQAKTEKSNALKIAQVKASNLRVAAKKLRIILRQAVLINPDHSIIKIGEESIDKVLKDLEKVEAEVSRVKREAKTAIEYQNLVNSSKEQFQKELKIILPNYIHGVKDKTVAESDLNLLIVHAHKRIEQLQKQLAKQLVTEKFQFDEALHQQKLNKENLTECRIDTELERHNVDFELELRKQLQRQSAAHADHIKEVLKVKEKELERRYLLDMEEKLLHQKGVFISEVSGSMARLKGILSFLKAKSKFDKASKNSQALWLACQSLNQKISSENGNLSPLAEDIAALKTVTDEENNDFLNSILAGLPSEAVTRGVLTAEVLKDRFHNVKSVCKKVALIDENHDSLYRYILSYIQSYLIVDTSSIPKAELNGKVAVDPSEWNIYDLLSRISYSLKINDFELALRYANQLKGEPKECAKDWIKELKLLLETKLAVQALLAHAVAIGVQTYN